MKLLFDEGTPIRLAKELTGHEWNSVKHLSWKGTKNGALLSRAELAGFEVLLTMDGNMGGEQNMRNRQIAILVLRPRKQGNEPARELAGKVLIALAEIQPGEIRIVRHDDLD